MSLLAPFEFVDGTDLLSATIEQSTESGGYQIVLRVSPTGTTLLLEMVRAALPAFEDRAPQGSGDLDRVLGAVVERARERGLDAEYVFNDDPRYPGNSHAERCSS